MAYDEILAGRVRSALEGVSGVTERRMFGGLAFLLNGRMCCGIVGDDLMVRVPMAEHEAALKRPHVRPMDFTGRPMKGFVYVAAAGIRTPRALRSWIARGQLVASATMLGGRSRATGRRATPKRR